MGDGVLHGNPGGCRVTVRAGRIRRPVSQAVAVCAGGPCPDNVRIQIERVTLRAGKRRVCANQLELGRVVERRRHEASRRVTRRASSQTAMPRTVTTHTHGRRAIELAVDVALRAGDRRVLAGQLEIRVVVEVHRLPTPERRVAVLTAGQPSVVITMAAHARRGSAGEPAVGVARRALRQRVTPDQGEERTVVEAGLGCPVTVDRRVTILAVRQTAVLRPVASHTRSGRTDELAIGMAASTIGIRMSAFQHEERTVIEAIDRSPFTYGVVAVLAIGQATVIGAVTIDAATIPRWDSGTGMAHETAQAGVTAEKREMPFRHRRVERPRDCGMTRLAVLNLWAMWRLAAVTVLTLALVGDRLALRVTP